MGKAKQRQKIGAVPNMSFKNVVIIYLVVMSYKSEFGMVSINKLKNNPVGNIDSNTPDLMSPWVQFFNSQRRVKRVVFKEFCLFYGFFLNIFRKVFEKLVEGFSAGNLHLFTFDKL